MKPLKKQVWVAWLELEINARQSLLTAFRHHTLDLSTTLAPHVRWHSVKGVIDIAKLSEYLQKIYSSPDFDSNMNVFWDLFEADFSNVNAEDIFHFKDYVGAHWGKDGKSKAALIVPDAVGYGKSRIYEIMMESKFTNNIEVFKDVDTARKWIQQ